MPHSPKKTQEHQEPISAGTEYDLVEFARKYNLSIWQADALIILHGPSRAKLDEVMRQELVIIDDTTGR